MTSDRGIMMQRRLLEQQMEVVARGGDPLGVSFAGANGTLLVDTRDVDTDAMLRGFIRVQTGPSSAALCRVIS